MTDQNKSENKESGGSTPKTSKESQTGDPGRTPGKAEGDEETIDESLRDKENQPRH